VRADHPEDKPLPQKCTDERETMSAIHEHFLSYCRFFAVRHPERPVVRYIRWEFFPDPQALERMFSRLKLARYHLDYFRKHSKPISKRLHPVFAEINNGGPYGRWIHDLCERPTRVLGLFVQAFGDL
jgi:hypothetical protein